MRWIAQHGGGAGEQALGPKDPFVGTLVWDPRAAVEGDSETPNNPTCVRSTSIKRVRPSDPHTAYPIQHLGDLQREGRLREGGAAADRVGGDCGRTLGDHPRLAMCLRIWRGCMKRGDTDRALDELKHANESTSARCRRTTSIRSWSSITSAIRIRRGEHDRALPTWSRRSPASSGRWEKTASARHLRY